MILFAIWSKTLDHQVEKIALIELTEVGELYERFDPTLSGDDLRAEIGANVERRLDEGF